MSTKAHTTDKQTNERDAPDASVLPTPVPAKQDVAKPAATEQERRFPMVLLKRLSLSPCAMCRGCWA